MKTVAQKIKKGSVPAKFFTPPPGIIITHNPEADRQSQRMAKKVIAMLLDPEAAKKKMAGSHESSSRSDNQRVERSTDEQRDGKDANPLSKGMDAIRGLFGK